MDRQFYCGIDLHTRKLDIAIVDPNGVLVFEKSLDCNLDLVLEALEPYSHSMTIVVETTCNWYWLVDGLMASGYEVKLAHSLRVLAILYAKIKTDELDAKALAELARLDAVPEAFIPDPEFREVRDIIRRRHDMVCERTVHFNRIRAEMIKFNTNIFTRDQLRNGGPDLVEELSMPELSRKQVCFCMERVVLLDRQVQEAEAIISNRTDHRPDVQSIRSMIGAGAVFAPMIVFESGDLFRFDSVKGYASYSRMIPGIHRSVNRSRRSPNSKQGNPYLKWAWVEVAMHACRLNERIRGWRDKHLNRIHHKRRKVHANHILAHKLARCGFMLMKNGGSFDIDIFLRS